MGHLRSVDDEPDLHLYKHYDTRRYLGIDEQLRCFAFLDGEDDKGGFECKVYYRRLRSTRDALELLDLHRMSPPSATVDPGVADNVIPLRPRRPGGTVA